MTRGKCRGKYFNYLNIIIVFFMLLAIELLIGKEILGKVTKKFLALGLLRAQEDLCAAVEVP